MGLTEIEESADSVAPPPLEWRIDLTNFRFTWWMVSRDIPIWTGRFHEYVGQTRNTADYRFFVRYWFLCTRFLTNLIDQLKKIKMFPSVKFRFNMKLHPLPGPLVFSKKYVKNMPFFYKNFDEFWLFWRNECYFGALDMADTLSLNFSNDVNTLNYQKPLLD